MVAVGRHAGGRRDRPGAAGLGLVGPGCRLAFDIDRVISRTLGYAIVTGLLVGVYAGLVLLATQ